MCWWFTFEISVKVVAYGGLHNFIRNGWNLFDLVVVGTTWMTILSNTPSGLASLRVVRLVKMSNRKYFIALMEIINVVLICLKETGSVLLFGFVIFFIYAVVGMKRFGELANEDATAGDADFSTFWRSMQTLFQIMCGSGFEDILISEKFHDVEPSNWDDIRSASDHNISFLYFLSFNVMSSYILLNL